MQTPPPFHGYEGAPQAPKRKNNTVVIILAVLGGLLICCGGPIGVGIYYGSKGLKGIMQIGGCVANVSIMQDALRKYAKDHDGKLPSASNWQAEVGKYMVKSKKADGSPIKLWTPGGEWACEDSGIKTGFMFNEALSEKKIADVIKADPEAMAIFEVKTVAFNQSGPLVRLPFDESPKIFGEFTDQRRGWFLINAEASTIYYRTKQGKLQVFNMNGKNGEGFNFDMESSSSNDSNPSKSDNSN